MIARTIAPTARTTPRRRRTVAATALVALLATSSLAACSGGDGKEDGVDRSTTSTTEGAPSNTTVPLAPLDDVAAEEELAYLSTDGTGTTIFLTDGKGSETEVIARLPARAEQLRWSPDGDQLLLDADPEGHFELQVIDAESGAVSPLAPSPTSNEGGANWSPDGSQVAFFSNRDGDFAGYVVDVATGAVRRVTPPEARGVGELVWSPDGSLLAFATSEQLESDVWVVQPDGTGARKVSTEAGSTQPAWSPDGRQLAISAHPVGEQSSGIYLLDPATGDTELLADTEYADGFPVWAPDGEQVYFIAATPNDDADGGSADDILAVDVDGGEPEEIVTDPISVEMEVAPSPGGELMAFSVQRLGDKEVFVANADGTGAIPISRSERLDAFPAWRPRAGS